VNWLFGRGDTVSRIRRLRLIARANSFVLSLYRWALVGVLVALAGVLAGEALGSSALTSGGTAAAVGIVCGFFVMAGAQFLLWAWLALARGRRRGSVGWGVFGLVVLGWIGAIFAVSGVWGAIGFARHW
jgi:hypothetical protein